MLPSLVIVAVTAFVSFVSSSGSDTAVLETALSDNRAEAVGITAAEYASVMASMSACGLSFDMSKVGELMIASGIDPKNQEQAEQLGTLLWEESQRVFTMSTAEQSAHCQRMRELVKDLGL